MLTFYKLESFCCGMGLRLAFKIVLLYKYTKIYDILYLLKLIKIMTLLIKLFLGYRFYNHVKFV